MTFKSNLHSLTLVLLASASTLALAQGVHLGGGASVGATGALQRPAMPAVPAVPATPAVPAGSAQSAITGNVAAEASDNAQAGMLKGTVQDASSATHGVANAVATGAAATTAKAADSAQADAQGGAIAASKDLKGASGMAAGKATLAADDSAKTDGSGAAHRSHKKAHKTQGHASPMSGEANAALGASTSASVKGGASAKTGQ